VSCSWRWGALLRPARCLRRWGSGRERLFREQEGQQGAFTPVVRDVEMRNVTSKKSKYGLYMRAYPKSEISDVRIVDCRFDGVEKGNVTEGVQALTLRNLTMNGRVVSE